MATKRPSQEETTDDEPQTKRDRQSEETTTGEDISNITESDGSPTKEADRRTSTDDSERETTNIGSPVVENKSCKPVTSEGIEDSTGPASQQPENQSACGTSPKTPLSPLKSSLDLQNHVKSAGCSPDRTESEIKKSVSDSTLTETNRGSEKLPFTAQSSKPNVAAIAADLARADIVQFLDRYYGEARCREIEDYAIRKGRPTPILLETDTITDPKTGTTISLSAYTYGKIPWLTGSQNLGKYFCWACLLFSSEEKWSLPGDVGWKQSSILILNHQLTHGHIAALRTLKQQEDSLKTPEPKEPQEAPASEKFEICRNRRFVELVIRMILISTTKRENIGVDFLAENEELMDVAMRHDPELGRFFGEQFTDGSMADFIAVHAAKLYDSILHVVKSSIRNEIINASHVTLLYADAVDVHQRASQVAVIARFVDAGGEVRERFLKLFKTGLPTSSRLINFHKFHAELVADLKLERKLVGHSLSGTVIPPSSLKELNDTVRSLTPSSEYLFWPGQNFKEVLLQSLSYVDPARDFFQVVRDLVEFFATNSGAIPTLVNFVKTSDPDCPWLYAENSFTHDMISTVQCSYPLFVQFFERVSKKFWNDEVVRQAPGFLRFLNRLENRFLLILVSFVLNSVNDLSRALEKNKMLHYRATSAIAKLQGLKRVSPTEFIKVALKNQSVSSEVRSNCICLFNDILATAIECIRHRCFNLIPFFVDKPSSGFFDVINNKAFMDRYFLATPKTDCRPLNSQIETFKSFEIMFLRKTFPEHVKLMDSLGLTQNFPSLLNFLRFCSLISRPDPDPESLTAKLKSYIKDKQKLTADGVLLHLEKDNIFNMMKNERFFDDVFNHYAKFQT